MSVLSLADFRATRFFASLAAEDRLIAETLLSNVAAHDGDGNELSLVDLDQYETSATPASLTRSFLARAALRRALEILPTANEALERGDVDAIADIDFARFAALTPSEQVRATRLALRSSEGMRHLFIQRALLPAFARLGDDTTLARLSRARVDALTQIANLLAVDDVARAVARTHNFAALPGYVRATGYENEMVARRVRSVMESERPAPATVPATESGYDPMYDSGDDRSEDIERSERVFRGIGLAACFFSGC